MKTRTRRTVLAKQSLREIANSKTVDKVEWFARIYRMFTRKTELENLKAHWDGLCH
jgi:hypothetical protein